MPRGSRFRLIAKEMREGIMQSYPTTGAERRKNRFVHYQNDMTHVLTQEPEGTITDHDPPKVIRCSAMEVTLPYLKGPPYSNMEYLWCLC